MRLKSNSRRALNRSALGLLLPIGFCLAALSWYGLATVHDVSRLKQTNPSTTALIQARVVEAREQGQPFNPERSWVPLSRISPYVQRAVIVAEDASFYSHEGFDWEGIKEAAVRNVEQGKLQRGGSSITQQLAKNLYLSSDKTLLRKVNEAMITLALEYHLSKKRILEIYLNVAEWGQDVYGVEAAARHHFGKSATDLTPAEAALLAAILPAPRQNDPLVITPYLSKRQQWILKWLEKPNGASAGEGRPFRASRGCVKLMALSASSFWPPRLSGLGERRRGSCMPSAISHPLSRTPPWPSLPSQPRLQGGERTSGGKKRPW